MIGNSSQGLPLFFKEVALLNDFIVGRATINDERLTFNRNRSFYNRQLAD